GARVGAGLQADVVLLDGEARAGAAQGLPAGDHGRLAPALRVEDLADDPRVDLLAAEGDGHAVADGLAGLGEEAGVDDHLAWSPVPAPGDDVVAGPRRVAEEGLGGNRVRQARHADPEIGRASCRG